MYKSTCIYCKFSTT